MRQVPGLKIGTDPEGRDGEGGVVQDGEHIHQWLDLMSMYGNPHSIVVTSLPIKIKLKIKGGKRRTLCMFIII